VLRALIFGFPVTTVLGALPGTALLVLGIITADWWLVAAATVLITVGFVIAMMLRLGWILTRTVPQKLFGICRGTSVGGRDGFTDWLSDKIAAAAKIRPRTRPLRFGDLGATAMSARSTSPW